MENGECNPLHNSLLIILNSLLQFRLTNRISFLSFFWFWQGIWGRNGRMHHIRLVRVYRVVAAVGAQVPLQFQQGVTVRARFFKARVAMRAKQPFPLNHP